MSAICTVDAADSGGKPVFAEFPGESPTLLELKNWLLPYKAALTSAGFGAMLRKHAYILLHKF